MVVTQEKSKLVEGQVDKSYSVLEMKVRLEVLQAQWVNL